ncbi:DUF411 domain-containing protein [Candidatus Woesearchaeota archaeon]|nr:MAG: DUF411 domain-containing protein [Candidatus Woesearchaeota archaeon]
MKPTIIALLAIAVLLASCTAKDLTEITVYKTPSCGCCGGYVSYLEKQGFAVNVIELASLDKIKEQYRIPDDLLSCHTSVIGNYYIEGHVPAEAIRALLEKQPSIDGIALPGMPAGSPGMGGTKMQPFEVLAVTNGEATDFIKV